MKLAVKWLELVGGFKEDPVIKCRSTHLFYEERVRNVGVVEVEERDKTLCH